MSEEMPLDLMTPPDSTPLADGASEIAQDATPELEADATAEKQDDVAPAGSGLDVQPSAGSEKEPVEKTAATEPVAGNQAAEKKPAERTSAAVAMLTLTPASISRDLVTLRRDSVEMAAPYERVAGRVLGRPWRRSSLFFTSTHGDEGSTAVAVNVATMLSRSAASVLLVELNLTEPSLWSLFGRPKVEAGLEDALRGRAVLDDCLCQIGGERLDVLMVKEAMSMQEVERLSGALNDFLEWAEERFAWLVVDCPPVLAASWTRWFDLNADPVVLVAGSAKTKKHELRKVANRLGDRLAGTILNENQRIRRAS